MHLEQFYRQYEDAASQQEQLAALQALQEAYKAMLEKAVLEALTNAGHTE